MVDPKALISGNKWKHRLPNTNDKHETPYMKINYFQTTYKTNGDQCQLKWKEKAGKNTQKDGTGNGE